MNTRVGYAVAVIWVLETLEPQCLEFVGYDSDAKSWRG